MDTNRLGFSLVFSLIVLLGLSAFFLCLIAEFHKAKAKDLKWNGEFCFLPRTHAFRLGVAALICASIAHIVGVLTICRGFWRRDITGCPKTPPFRMFLLFFSWISFAVAFALVSTAASMNKEQRYGEGWMNRECYIVKDGVFAASGVLIVITLVAGFAAAASRLKRLPLETEEKLNINTV